MQTILRIPPSIPSILLLFFLLCVSTVAMAGMEAEEPGVEFVAQGLPNPGATSIHAIAQREVLRNFLQEYPDYDIQPFAMPQVGVEAAMDSGTLMAISAGMAPNAIYVNFRQSATFNEQGFLLPMETLLARVLSDNPLVREVDEAGEWKADPTEAEIRDALEKIRERVPGRAWPVVYREDMSGRSDDLHVWSLPKGNLVRALFYRKDVFQAAGLDPDEPPDTWEEFLEYARILHDPEHREYALAVAPGINISHTFYNFIVSSGSRAMRRTEDGSWKAAFAERGAAEGIYFIWRLLREPFLKPDGREVDGAAALRSDGRLLWERGQLAMRFGVLNDEMLASVPPQLVGIAPVPKGPTGVRGGIINARMMGIFSQSTPAQQLAVMRYIWYITGEEAEQIRTRVLVNGGYGQFISPDLLEKFGYTRLLERVPEGWQEAYEDAMSDGVPEPYGRNTQFIYRALSAPINYALEQDYTQVSKEAAVEDILGQLEISAGEVNIKALGRISPEEMTQRRIVSGLVLAVLVAAFTWGMRAILKSMSKAAPSVEWSKQKRNLLWGWALLLPGFGLVIFWQYLPLLIGGIGIAFMDYQVVLESTWVGIDNFANVLYNPDFWEALWKEFYFVALTIGLGFWPPILLAILLQEVPTDFAKYFFRTVFYLPSVLIGIVVMFLWMQLFDPSAAGTINQFLLSLNQLGPVLATLVKWLLLGFWLSLIGLLACLPWRVWEMPLLLKISLWAIAAVFLGLTLAPVFSAAGDNGVAGSLSLLSNLYGRFELEPLRWLQDPALAMICIIIPSVWAASGPGCIIYLAGLKSVPDELYEAAAIDGAGFWHRIFYIVLPRLKFLIVINLIMAMVGAFKGGADQILIMTGGGPNEATTTLSLRIFYKTFMDLEYGIGTAMSWLMGGLLIGFTAYQMKMLSNAEFKAQG